MGASGQSPEQGGASRSSGAEGAGGERADDRAQRGSAARGPTWAEYGAAEGGTVVAAQLGRAAVLPCLPRVKQESSEERAALHARTATRC